MDFMKSNTKAGRWTVRVLVVMLSVMLIVTMIPTSGLGRVYAEPETNTEEFPVFSQQVEVDGILVSVEAPEGVFPAGAELVVKQVPDDVLKKAEESIDGVRGQGMNVVRTSAVNIKVLDAEENELQPADGQTAAVSFGFSQEPDPELTASVYQITGADADTEYTAEKRETEWDASTNTIKVDAESFSSFVVEFTSQALRDTDDAGTDPFSEFWNEESGCYILASGTYTMTEDFVAQGYIYVPKDETVTIDLRGYALKRELESSVAKGYIIENEGTLTIRDTSSDAAGKITGGNNGGTSRGGGGIYNLGTFNLEGGSITGNKARMFGGGIYNEARGTVNITGGSITNNTTQKGGGILNSGTMNISNAVISGNVATADQGGGIYTERNITMSGTPVIRNNTPMDLFLNGNTVVKVEGKFGIGTTIGVSAASPYRKITSGFKASGNSSEDVQSVFLAGEGYALKESGGEVYLIETGTEINDWADLQQAVKDAPDNTRTVLTLSDDVTANSNQGRIQILINKDIVLDLAGHKLNRSKSSTDRYGQVIGVYGKLTIVDSSGNDSGKITGGNAERGGGINVDDTGECVLKGGSVTGNNASGDGGGVYVWGTFRMSGGKVSGNNASGSDSDGGGIAVNGEHQAVLDITGGEIRSNRVWAEDDEGRAGGAIAAWSGATVDISNAYIGSNVSRMEGGAIYTTASATISNCTFKGNSTQSLSSEEQSYGTMYPYDQYSLFFLHETFDGGAIYVTGSAEVAIDHSTFDDNYVKNCELTRGGHGVGGAICVSGSGKLNISDSLFRGNLSWDGGAIYTNTDTKVTITDTRFEGNHVGPSNFWSYKNAMPGTDQRISSGGGGGITSYGTLTLEGCTFSGNYLTTDMDSAKGGAVYCKGKLTMDDVTCTRNKGRLGGGVYLGGNTATLTNCTLQNNEALVTGGGVHVGSSDQFTVKGKTAIDDNFANVGNDVYLPNGKYITLTEPIGFNSDIGVALEKEYGQFTKNFTTHHTDVVPETYFYSSDGYEVILKDNEGYIKQATLDDEHRFIKWKDQVKTNTYRLNGQNWMAGISGERYLSEINIPCTHDSSMCYPDDTGAILGRIGATFAQTQVAYIDQQLKDGIRCVDLRLIDEYPDTNISLGWLAPSVGGIVAEVGLWFLGGIGVGAILGIVAGYVVAYMNPQVCIYNDDGENLYLCHGKTGAGRYYAVDKDGDYLTLNKELDWMKEFLTKHPTETIIVEVKAETDDGKWVMKRLRRIIKELSMETNRSTGESFVYWEKDESGKDKICEPFEHYPQMKDCRGKIIFAGAVSEVGGFTKPMDNTKVESPEGSYTDNAETKLAHLRAWFNTHHTKRIPANATGERNKTVYSVGTNGTDMMGLQTPVDISKDVLPVLSREWIGENHRGQYLGFITMDGSRQPEAYGVWTTNFFSDLEYCTVKVVPGDANFGSEKPEVQTYQLLKGTKIKIPGCIYDGSPADRFKGWEADGKVYNLSDDYEITQNVVFTAQWDTTTQTPVTVVWNDAGDFEKKRPEDLKISYRDQYENGFTKTITADGNWTSTISGKLNGDPVPEALAGYDAKVTGGQGKTGYTITMTHTPQVDVNTSGKVTWNDSDNAEKIRPESVTVRLFKNGTEVAAKEVTGDAWEYDFGTKQQYENGEKVEYWIQQDEIPAVEGIGGYSVGIDGFNITNSHDVEVTVTACVIEWDDNYDARGIRPESVTIHWKLNGKELSEQVVTPDEDGLWMGALEMNRADMQEISEAADEVVQKYVALAEKNEDGKLTEAQQKAMEEELSKISEITVTQDPINEKYETKITLEAAETGGEGSEKGKSAYFKIKNSVHEHMMTPTPAKEATCTEPGNTAYWTCDKEEAQGGPCGKYFGDKDGTEEIEKDSWIIPAAGHKLNKTKAVDATCTEDGKKAFWTCSVCKKKFFDEEATQKVEDENDLIIPATGHDWGEIKYTWEEDNSKVTAKRICNTVTSHVEEETVAASSEVTTKAGCLTDGKRTYTSVAFKNEAFEQQSTTEVIAATGHDWGDWVDVKASTCIAKGQRMHTCRNDESHIEYEEIALLKHEIKHHAAVAATCTANGNIEYWTCGKCGHYFSDEDGKIQIAKADTVLKALDHNWGTWKKLNRKQHQRVCTNDSRHVQKKNHNWDAGKVTKEPTKTAAGIKTFTCAICKATKTKAIPKLNDVLAAEIKAKGKKSFVISWNKVDGADGYDVFFSRCNGKSSASMKKVKTLKGNETFSWTIKGLKKHKSYKARVRAWKIKSGKKTYIKTSLTFHAYSFGYSKKYTNAKSVKVKKTAVTLKQGKTFKIKAKVTKLKKKKKLISKKHGAKLRYQSTNQKIATVNASGKIRAKAKGTCYIYVYAHNGVSKKVKVTVN